MAWEWIGTSTVGALGIIFTWLTGKQSRDQALATLRQQLGHDRLQAREAREQERLENAYLELLKMAERVGQWAQTIYPFAQFGALPDTPLPSLEVQADTAALLAAFGTEEVREKAEAWQLVVKKMIALAALVPLQDKDSQYVQPGDRIARAKIEDIRPEEKKKRDELGAQIRSELAFGYRSTREHTGVTRSYTTPPGQEPPSGQLPSVESPEP
jgi:hypothetical protein